MEPFITVAVIAVFLFVLGFKVMTIILIAVAFAGVLFLLAYLLLVYFFVRMLFGRRRDASFSHIAKSPRGVFKVAYYVVDGKEYPNIFPEEGVMVDKLYKSGKKYRVLLDRRKKYVYDRFAVTTCTVGFVFGTGATAFAAVFILGLI